MKHCLVCGIEFEAGTPASRKYCLKCAEVRKAELEKLCRERRKAREADRAVEKASLKKESAAKSSITREDVEYCKSCIYKGNLGCGGLCDYAYKMFQLRGCRAGVGCDKRKRVEKS